MDAVAQVQDALATLGIPSAPAPPGSPANADLVIDADGIGLLVELTTMSLVDERSLPQRTAPAPPNQPVRMLVADRVTAGARRQLLQDGAGYLDLRGHLGIKAPGLVVSADVPAQGPTRASSNPLAGQAGLEVATSLLMNPQTGASVRSLARDLDRSPSTVSTILKGLREDGLIEPDHTVRESALFWQVTERWSGKHTYLAEIPDPSDPQWEKALRLGHDNVDEPGWALTDTAAAAAYGAPVAFRDGQQLTFFVPNESTLNRATRLLGTQSTPTLAPAAVRVAPVPAVCQRRVSTAGLTQWGLAHPLFVALDLAQDPGRGREVLQHWNPTDWASRVW
jgi:hypothetical protein